jgi:hypothetical protein
MKVEMEHQLSWGKQDKMLTMLLANRPLQQKSADIR